MNYYINYTKSIYLKKEEELFNASQKGYTKVEQSVYNAYRDEMIASWKIEHESDRREEIEE